MAKRKTRKASTSRSAKRRPAKKPARKAKKRGSARPAAARGGNDLRALARRIVAVTTANDDEATLALYASDVESKEQGQPPMHGIDGIRQKFVGWRNMVSAAHFEPRRVIVDGNTIVIETTSDRGNGPSTSKAVYSMEGEWLVIATTNPGRGGGEPTTTKRYYKKG